METGMDRRSHIMPMLNGGMTGQNSDAEDGAASGQPKRKKTCGGGPDAMLAGAMGAGC